jgi:hypothetical protein
VRVWVIRTVSRSDDARICGPRASIHANPVCAVQACTFGELRVRYDPDADDSQITIKRFAVRACYSGDDIVSAETRDFRVAVNVDARRAVLPSVEIRCLRAYNATHHTFRRFENCDLDSKADSHGCDLEPNVPASNNHEPRACTHLRCNRVGIPNRANVMDARQCGTGNGNPADTTSGCEQQVVIMEVAAARQANASQSRVEFLGARAEIQLDVAARIETRWLQIQSFACQ